MKRTVSGIYGENEKRGFRLDPERGVRVPFAFRWLWGDTGDGTRFVIMVDDNMAPAGDTKFFPADWEAQRYAELMAQGHEDAGAMTIIHDERVEKVREP